jgi:hypothetical protein
MLRCHYARLRDFITINADLELTPPSEQLITTILSLPKQTSQIDKMSNFKTNRQRLETQRVRI